MSISLLFIKYTRRIMLHLWKFVIPLYNNVCWTSNMDQIEANLLRFVLKIEHISCWHLLCCTIILWILWTCWLEFVDAYQCFYESNDLEFPPQTSEASGGNSVHRIACESRTWIRISDWTLLKTYVSNEIWAIGPNFMSNSYSHWIVDMINVLIFGYHHSSSRDIWW